MYKDLFTQSGLTNNEAIIYEYLLKNGESSAQDIEKNTPLKKGVIYLALNDLIKKALIVEKMLAPRNPNVRNKKKIAYFNPEHPEKLREYLDNQENVIKKAQKNLEANLSDVISNFNLVSGKPGMRFFEGLEGIKKVLEDTLTSKSTIRTYIDIESIVKYINDINKEYVKKREALKIKKRGLVLDSEFARKYLKDYHSTVTDTKFLKKESVQFNTIMQIYDNKISYMTLSENNKIGIIIEDPNIYLMHKTLFDLNWKNAKSVN